ncbi:hypothetical protein C8J35_1366 [Rhizobium sp. PP-F2F-G38]|nr:hypothetical protein C8J35_1366 [Rhizobium sp. PP-F2F-G38]
MIEVIDGRVVWTDSNGSIDIASPWTDEGRPLGTCRLMEGDWLFLGSFQHDGIYYVDFIQLRGLDMVARWKIDHTGAFAEQTHFKVAQIGPLARMQCYAVTNAAGDLVRLASGYCNDVQIYSFLRFILNDKASALAFINAYAPQAYTPKSSVASGQYKVHANFIFNHNYARNIPRIDLAYRHRFSSISYILPNICPQSANCFAFPAGSFSYHALIYYMIDQAVSKGVTDPDAWYLFAHDDVYLNRNFSEAKLDQYTQVHNDTSCLYYLDPFAHAWDHQSEWQWNTRILAAIFNQKSPVVGNGFEGLNVFFEPELLTNAVGDIFFVKGAYLKEFGEILGNFISQDVFPEVAIPSSLKALCGLTGTKPGIFRGHYLWADNRNLVNEEFISKFDATDALFFHPVKSRMLS